MKSASPSSRKAQAQSRPATKKTIALEKNLHTLTQNPNRLKLVKAVYAGHVRGGHAFH